MWSRVTAWQTLHQHTDMEVDEETLLPPPRINSTEPLHYPPLLRFKIVSLIRDLIQEGGRLLGTQIISQGVPTLSTSRLEAKHVLHWLEKGTTGVVCVFWEKEAESGNLYMSETQRGVVCRAVFQDIPFEIHVLIPTNIGRSGSHTW
jgi:hypothetical protein